MTMRLSPRSATGAAATTSTTSTETEAEPWPSPRSQITGGGPDTYPSCSHSSTAEQRTALHSDPSMTPARHHPPQASTSMASSSCHEGAVGATRVMGGSGGGGEGSAPSSAPPPLHRTLSEGVETESGGTSGSLPPAGSRVPSSATKLPLGKTSDPSAESSSSSSGTAVPEPTSSGFRHPGFKAPGWLVVVLVGSYWYACTC